MEILHYFDSVNKALINDCGLFNKSVFGKKIRINTEETPLENLENINLAIIGVPEDRNSLNKGCSLAPDFVRKYLYALNCFDSNNIADLGNIKKGNTPNDSYFAIRDVVVELLENNIHPIIIGGTQDITYATFLAYEKLKQAINIVTVDSRLDFGEINDPVNSSNYLSKIIAQKSNCLFNFTNIGYQSYYVSREETDLMKNIFFDCYRLGVVQSNLKETEPIFRDSSLVSIDVSAIRQSDAPANFYPSPNGLYGEEVCQMARFAGLSDKVTCFGMYEINPHHDINGQTSHLSAEIIWHFIEGYFLRNKDYPYRNLTEYKKYIVKTEDSIDEFIFYHNPLTDRWWIEVPYQKANYSKSIIISCSFSDYEKACSQEIPDRWWRTFQKIC